MPLMHWRDVPAALGLLTRLPVSVATDHATARGAQAAWAYPLVGLVMAILVAVIGWLTSGLMPELRAAIMLGAGVVVTGALHEDGLADTVDGLWGGWDKARRLEIMKDSHIGTYGVIGLVLSLLLRWLCLTSLLQSDHWVWALMAVAMVSRAAMVAVMAVLPNARDGGLSRSVGRPGQTTALLACGIAACSAIIGLGASAVTVLVIAAGTAMACGFIAKRKIGGQTGDILGATQQVTEIAVLIALTTL